MTRVEDLRKRLGAATRMQDPLQRHMFVLGVITAALEPHQVRPVLIGGAAIEFYTFGGYNTGDIDLAVADHLLLAGVMDKLGFERRGRVWYHPQVAETVESPASTLDEATAPLTIVQVQEFRCHIIGVEDLIIDRLNGYVHWNWADDRRWATNLIALHRQDMDWEYVRQRAVTEGVDRALQEIEEGLGEAEE